MYALMVSLTYLDTSFACKFFFLAVHPSKKCALIQAFLLHAMLSMMFFSLSGWSIVVMKAPNQVRNRIICGLPHTISSGFIARLQEESRP
jgi:hypothetical protein